MPDGIYQLLRELDQAQARGDDGDDNDNESVLDDSDGDSDYESFVKELLEFKNGNKAEIQGIILYVYQPWCPHCKNFMESWETETQAIKDKTGNSVKSFKIKADDIEADDDLIPPKNTVPQVVMYYYKSPNGVMNKDLSDEKTRQNLSKLVEDILEIESESESDEETEPKQKKTEPKQKKTEPKQKKTEQKGKGIVESVLTAGILGGAVISATKSPQVASILKETVKGVESITSIAKSSVAKISGKKPSKNVIRKGISSAVKAVNAQKYADATTDAIKGISQTTADVIQGKVKKLTQKDLMKVYKTFKSSKKSQRGSSRRKLSPSKSNKTRKVRK